MKTECEIYIIQQPKALVNAFYLSRRHASANVPSIFVDDSTLRLVPVTKRSQRLSSVSFAPNFAPSLLIVLPVRVIIMVAGGVA